MPVACFLIPGFGIAYERRRDGSLIDRPVALTQDGRLQSVSQEARPFGVGVGQTVSGARSLCPDLATPLYDLPAYTAAARLLWDLVAVETSVVEPLSPHLCYAELTGPAIEPRTDRLVEEMVRLSGAQVYAGLARTKLLARLVAERNSAGPAVNLPVEREAELLAAIPIEQVASLERSLLQQLQRLGIRRLGEVQALAADSVPRSLRQSWVRLKQLARGEDGENVRSLWPPRRIEYSAKFEYEVEDEEAIAHALALCAERIGRALVEKREYCRYLTLALQLADRKRLESAEQLPAPLNGPALLHRAALRLRSRLKLGAPVVELSLAASEIDIGAGVQLALLNADLDDGWLPHEKRARIDNVMAFVRKRFGVGAIRAATAIRPAAITDLWTSALCRRCNEPVQVETDSEGTPTRYWRCGVRHDVIGIQDRWRETVRDRGTVSERTIFRVQTPTCGVSELRQTGSSWLLAALID